MRYIAAERPTSNQATTEKYDPVYRHLTLVLAITMATVWPACSCWKYSKIVQTTWIYAANSWDEQVRNNFTGCCTGSQ